MRLMRETAFAAVLCLAAAAAASARTDGTPTIRFTDLTPVQVKGTRFLPGDMIRVVLRAGESKRVRTIRVSARGSFSVNFGTLPRRDTCSGEISLVTVPAKGIRAAYRLPTVACIDPYGPPTTIAPGSSSRQGA